MAHFFLKVQFPPYFPIIFTPKHSIPSTSKPSPHRKCQRASSEPSSPSDSSAQKSPHIKNRCGDQYLKPKAQKNHFFAGFEPMNA